MALDVICKRVSWWYLPLSYVFLLHWQHINYGMHETDANYSIYNQHQYIRIAVRIIDAINVTLHFICALYLYAFVCYFISQFHACNFSFVWWHIHFDVFNSRSSLIVCLSFFYAKHSRMGVNSLMLFTYLPSNQPRIFRGPVYYEKGFGLMTDHFFW